MREWLITSAGACSIAILLFIFYAAIKTRWPESYVSASEDVGLIINRNVGRYLLFMLLPTYIVSLIVTTTTKGYGGNPTICALAGVFIHLTRTQGRHYVQHVARTRNHTRLPATFVTGAVVIGGIAAAFVGSLGPGPFTAVVPPIDEFFKSLWTTVFVALLAVVALRMSHDTTSAWTLAQQSRKEVGGDLLRFAREESKSKGADPVLVEGILLTENLQRPKWIRRLERWKGWLSPEGTYGVMQVRSATPLSDHESIVRAISEHLVTVRVRRDRYGFYDHENLRLALRDYNSNEDFVQTAADIIGSIDIPNPISSESHSSEELIEERVSLAVAIWTHVASRIATKSGIASIAKLPITDLRTFHEIVERLPIPEDPASQALAESIRTALKDAGAIHLASNTDATEPTIPYTHG
jgi:hypothetical protein